MVIMIKLKIKFFFHIFCTVLFIINSTYIYSFHYDSAAQILQQGKWQEAYEMLVPLVIDNPDKADVLYDAGIAAYHLQKYTQASTYFIRAAENTKDNNLKSNAY